MYHQNNLIPQDELGEELKDDILHLFSFSDSDITTLVKELEGQQDSLNTSNLLNLVDIDIEDIEVCTRVIMYIIHMINTHGLSYEDIKKELIELPLEKNKIIMFIEQLSKIQHKNLKGIDKLYYADVARMENNYVQRITGYENYAYVTDENSIFQGLVPIIRVQLEISDTYGDEIKTLDIYHSLNSLNSMIKKLQRIYNNVYSHAISIKEKSEISLISIPNSDEING